jgi:hypothetical protein
MLDMLQIETIRIRKEAREVLRTWHAHIRRRLEPKFWTMLDKYPAKILDAENKSCTFENSKGLCAEDDVQALQFTKRIQ